MDESIEKWYFDAAAGLHVTGNRAHFLTLSDVSTRVQSIHGVTPNIIARYRYGGRKIRNTSGRENIGIFPG